MLSEKRKLARRVSRHWKFQDSEIDEWMRNGEAAPGPREREDK